MKNQGVETKTAPRPSRTSTGMGLEEGDSPDAAAPPEGRGIPGDSGGFCPCPWLGAVLAFPGMCEGGFEPGKSQGNAFSAGGWAAVSSSLWEQKILVFQGRNPEIFSLFLCVCSPGGVPLPCLIPGIQLLLPRFKIHCPAKKPSPEDLSCQFLWGWKKAHTQPAFL